MKYPKSDFNFSLPKVNERWSTEDFVSLMRRDVNWVPLLYSWKSII